MKSKVKLIASGGGYFLTIGDNYSEHTWAVTKEELEMLKRILNNQIELK